MPVLNGKELRIVGFLCNWCSYGGADTAGVARATQPTDLRVIRVPCSGRIDPLFIVKALLNGADGVLVSGCHPRDCHYAAGNFYARRRLEVLKQFLPVLGIDERRFEYTWVSASEGQRWQQVVTVFTDRIHKLGPAPKLEDPEPLLKIADMALTSLRSLGWPAPRLYRAARRAGRPLLAGSDPLPFPGEEDLAGSYHCTFSIPPLADPARIVEPLKAALASGSLPIAFAGSRGCPAAVLRRLRSNSRAKKST